MLVDIEMSTARAKVVRKTLQFPKQIPTMQLLWWIFFFAEFCGPVVVVAAAPGLPSLIDGVPTALCTA